MKVLKLCFKTSEGLREALGLNFLVPRSALGWNSLGVHCICALSFGTRAPQSTAPSTSTAATAVDDTVPLT